MFILDDVFRHEKDFSFLIFLRDRKTCHEIGMFNIFPGRRFIKPYVVFFYRRI